MSYELQALRGGAQGVALGGATPVPFTDFAAMPLLPAAGDVAVYTPSGSLYRSNGTTLMPARVFEEGTLTLVRSLVGSENTAAINAGAGVVVTASGGTCTTDGTHITLATAANNSRTAYIEWLAADGLVAGDAIYARAFVNNSAYSGGGNNTYFYKYVDQTEGISIGVRGSGANYDAIVQNTALAEIGDAVVNKATTPEAFVEYFMASGQGAYCWVNGVLTATAPYADGSAAAGALEFVFGDELTNRSLTTAFRLFDLYRIP